MENTKYPRTYHVPFSPGATADDKKLSDNWFDNYKGQRIIITEKLDGQNQAMSQKGIFARSHNAECRNPWDINLWGNDGLYWKIRNYIGQNEIIYGENLYGIHSIEYNNLPNYFFIFGVLDTYKNIWYSWDDVVELSYIMNILHVPVLFDGVFNSEDELKTFISETMKKPSTFGDTKEGVVIRIADSFSNDGDNFKNNVCKYVRANHVQTDKHWTRNWKKAKLII